MDSRLIVEEVMLTNTFRETMRWSLRKAFKNHNAPIWKALEHKLTAHRSNRREVNTSRLAKITNNGETVIIPGKVLGSGSIGHKLTVCAFSFSQVAAKRIIDSGGKVITLDDLIENFPDGKGVRIIG